VHRDLKLDNVLVTRAFWDDPEKPDNIKVVDFGIAKLSDGSHALTAIDTIVGTIAYLAPELLDPAYFRSNGATAAADVFAFGVLAWKLLVGGHPTGLPAGAGIVDYGAAYRTAAGRTQAWPPDAPPGAWGHLLSECLRVRAAERIADGVVLAERCEQAGDFSTVVRPAASGSGPTSVASPGAVHGKTGALATPADPLAPTAEIGPAGAAPEPAPSADRADRARAVTEHQPVIARRSEPESLTGDAVVKPQTQLSAPLNAPARESSFKAAPMLIGALLLVALGVVGFSFLAPAKPSSPPLQPTVSAPPTRGAAPLPTAAMPAPEAAAEDAADEPASESPTRPAECSADQPICECCRSGRDCGPGHCDDDLNPEEEWHLRVGGGIVDGIEIGNPALNRELCVRIARVGDQPHCTMLNAPEAVNARLQNVQITELQGHGLEIELKDAADAAGRSLKARLKPKLTRLALCQGIEVDQFRAADPPGANSAKLVLFLDDPGNPPQRCSVQKP